MIACDSHRQVVINIETTGLVCADGHRVIEIAVVEVVDCLITGRHFHTYVNPQRDSDEGALRVHGITSEFLSDKPRFQEIAQEFKDFVRGAELVAHNAPSDVEFLDRELEELNVPSIEHLCPNIIDTWELAKALRPGERNSLIALCDALAIEVPDSKMYGALLDANLLAKVYLALSEKTLH